MKEIIFLFTYFQKHGIFAKKCYKEKLTPTQFQVDQPPIRGRIDPEKRDEQVKLENRIPIIDRTPFAIVPKPPEAMQPPEEEDEEF